MATRANKEAANSKEIQAIIDGLDKERDFISKKILGLQKFIDGQNPLVREGMACHIRRAAEKQAVALNGYLGTLDELIRDLNNDREYYLTTTLPKGLKSIVERL